MERTTKIFLLNDTSKALQNQDFSENWFRSGHSFSSQPRYDHFDTAAHEPYGHHTANLSYHDFPGHARGFSKKFGVGVPAGRCGKGAPAFCLCGEWLRSEICVINACAVFHSARKNGP